MGSTVSHHGIVPPIPKRCSSNSHEMGYRIDGSREPDVVSLDGLIVP